MLPRCSRYQHFTRCLLLCTGLLVTGFAQGGLLEKLFAPAAEIWPVWQQHQATATRHIDHAPWEHFLQRYVQRGSDGINRLPYAHIRPTERRLLKDYIAALQAVHIHDYSRPEQLAYWINLYNAVTVDIVLDHYPVSSIKDIDISPGFLSDGPWGKKLLSIEGESLSLNDIEHRILRPIWRDPRIHYAVNCASLGCPDLQNRAYTADNIEALLDNAARTYINHPRGVHIEGDNLYISSIYSWFQDDFGNSEADVIRHLRSYAEPALAKQLEGFDFIAGDDYNWALNDVRPPATTNDE